MYIPPLRDRGNDIVLIANEFLKNYCNKMMKPRIKLSKEDTVFLKNYRWPGNVRELQNMMERAVILANNVNIDWAQLIPQQQIKAQDNNDSKILTQKEIQDIEKQNLLKALKSVKWKISGKNGAAALLGLKPTTLTSKIKALGLERPI